MAEVTSGGIATVITLDRLETESMRHLLRLGFRLLMILESDPTNTKESRENLKVIAGHAFPLLDALGVDY